MTIMTSRTIAPAAPTSSNWQRQAVCAQTDPELFFPEGSGSSAGRKAKKVCVVCPVRQQCLDFAIEQRLSCGVWGGQSGPALKKLIRAAKLRDAGSAMTDDGPVLKKAPKTNRERVEQIAEYKRRGYSYEDIDRKNNFARGRTARFIHHARGEYAKAGEPFPEALKAPVRLSPEAVVEIRERSVAGETDAVLGLEFGLTERSVAGIRRGDSYASFGGPTRRGRTVESEAASREYMCGHAADSKDARPASVRRQEQVSLTGRDINQNEMESAA